MFRIKLLIALISVLLIWRCATPVKAPLGTVPDRKGITTDAYGGWINLTQLDSSVTTGELIAVNSDTLFILSDDGFRGIDKNQIVKARLVLYNASVGAYAAWSVLGTFSSLSHGYYASVSLPMWLISGIATTGGESKRINYIDFGPDWIEEFGKHARFPQGLPSGLEVDQLKPKPRMKK